MKLDYLNSIFLSLCGFIRFKHFYLKEACSNKNAKIIYMYDIINNLMKETAHGTPILSPCFDLAVLVSC